MLNPVTPDFIARLAVDVPNVLRPTGPAYAEDPRGRVTGRIGAVAAPESVEDAAAVIRLAAAARVPVVPFGGGTGLVRGQLAPEGPAPLILSLERMTRIRAVHPDENLLIAEAGATLAEVQAAASEHGRLFPLSYASEGTARIGGALAVNSGGLNVLRYGTARDLCLGIEAVLPDGTIWHGLKRLRKDNTGYDLRDLLIGSEGTLGLITAAVLRLFPRPGRVATAMLDVTGPAAALDMLALAQELSGGAVSAFELMSGTGFAFLQETGFAPRLPFPAIPRWTVLVELGTPAAVDAEAVLEALFERAVGAGWSHDGVIAQSEGQRADLWRLREDIPLANRAIGAIASHDISLPLGALAAFVDETGPKLSALGPIRVNAFGHLGDGNLHYNVFPPAGSPASDWRHLEEAVSGIVYGAVAARGGSFSAEHGIGRLKVAQLERDGDPAKLAAMRAIKTALDPAGIMNPGAVLRAGE